MHRAAAAALGAALSLSALTGCASVCTTVGWVNGVVVDVGAIEGVAELQFCVERECSPREGETPPTASSSMLGASADGDDWTLHLDMGAPDTVVIRLFTADGSLLRESEHPIDWTPPTGQCGGASTAPPIVLAP